MTEPARRPTGAAIAAALSPFMGLPLTFLFLLATLGAGVEDGYGGGPFARLSYAWVEGGWSMYLIVLAGGGVAVVVALLMFFGVQRGSGAVLASAPLSSGLVAVGAFGSWTGMTGSIEAIAHAHPADRATILAGATGETLNTSLFGLCAMGGMLGALLPGLLLGVIAQSGLARRLLVVTMGVFGSLMLVAWVLSKRLAELMGSLKAVAHGSPVDRLTILAGVGEELSRYRLYATGALGLLLVVVAVGAVTLKGAPKLAVMVPLLGLGGLFGFGVQSFVERPPASASAILSPRAPLGLVELRGFGAGEEPRWCVSPKSLVACDLEGLKEPVEHEVLVDELESRTRLARDFDDPTKEDAEPAVALGIVRGASSAASWAFLQTAARVGVRRVALVGEVGPREVKLPAELQLIGNALDVPFRMVPIGLAAEGSGCGRSCTRATVDGDVLVVGDQRWTAAPVEGVSRRLEQQVAITGTPGLSPETVVKVALAAAAHDRRLVVLMPDAVFARVEPPDAEGSEADREAVQGLMGTMFGAGAPLDEAAAPPGDSEREQLNRIVRQHVRALQACYERALVKKPDLKGKIVLSWTVEADGSVDEVEVESNTLGDPEVTRCLSAQPKTWTFPKPARGEPVRVSFPFVFSPAQ
jgi:hypothetical protein